MPDDVLTPAPAAGNEPAATPAVTPAPTPGTDLPPGATMPDDLAGLQKLAAQLLKDKQEANKEAQRAKDELQKRQAADEEQRRAKLDEQTRLKEDYAKLEAELKATTVGMLRAQAAAKHSLGDLAEFLTGETPDAIEAQAAKLAERLKRAPQTGAGNPGGPNGEPRGETRDQRLARLYGNSADVWSSPEGHGGGVFVNGEPIAR